MNRNLKTLIVALTTLTAGTTAQAQRLLGGDISLLPSYEQRGTVYRTADGTPRSMLEIAREARWNSARVRLFVDPEQAPTEHKAEGVCQDLDYVAALSRQIHDAGMSLMLDFHYSDTWADPGKQFTPHRWQGATADALADSVYAYTTQALTALRNRGVVPELIQVGNEITFGMLWPTGRVEPLKDEGWDVLARLLSAGARACREQCPEAKLIIHTEHAGDWDMTRGYYERLDRYGVDYDVIGLSYYPMWHKSVENLDRTLDSIACVFPQREVMIVETAFYYAHENDAWATADQYADLYPISAEGQAQFTRELVTMLRRHANVTGLYWWFPEENASGEQITEGWLNRGLFSNHTGRALPALEELGKYMDK